MAYFKFLFIVSSANLTSTSQSPRINCWVRAAERQRASAHVCLILDLEEKQTNEQQPLKPLSLLCSSENIFPLAGQNSKKEKNIWEKYSG